MKDGCFLRLGQQARCNGLQRSRCSIELVKGLGCNTVRNVFTRTKILFFVKHGAWHLLLPARRIDACCVIGVLIVARVWLFIAVILGVLQASIETQLRIAIPVVAV